MRRGITKQNKKSFHSRVHIHTQIHNRFIDEVSS